MQVQSRLTMLKKVLWLSATLVGLLTLSGCGQIEFVIQTPDGPEEPSEGESAFVIGFGRPGVSKDVPQAATPGSDGDDGERSTVPPAVTPTPHPPTSGHSLIDEPEFLVSFFPVSQTLDPYVQFDFGAELSYSSEGNTKAGVTAFGLKQGEYVPDPEDCEHWVIPDERPFWHDEDSFGPGHNLYLRRDFTYQDDPAYGILVVWARVWGDDEYCEQRVYTLDRPGDTPTPVPTVDPTSTPLPVPSDPTPTPPSISTDWNAYTGDDVVRAVAVEVNGTVWTGGDDGLYMWNLPEGTQVHYPMRNVRDIVVAADGAIWAATFGDGVYRISTSWTHFTDADGLANEVVSDIEVSPRGGLWFATGSGLSFYKDGSWTNYTTPRGVTSIAVGANGTVWCGTYDGVYSFDGQEWEHSLTDNVIVWTLDITINGSIWIGTSGHGVYQYDGNSWTHYTTADGLCEDTILSVAVEWDDTLWAGGNSGVCRFDGQNWVGYTASHGLPGHSVPAVTVGPDRSVWLGSGNGIAQYIGS